MIRTVAAALITLLFLATPNADAQTKLSGDRTFPEAGVGDVLQFGLSSAGAGSGQLVYLADQRLFDNEFEVFAVPLDGGDWIPLNAPLPEGGSVLDFRVSPDGSLVAYRARLAGSSRVGLHVVTIDGSPVTSVMVGVPFGEEATETYEFTNDSSWIVFRTDDGTNRLYRASADGSAPAVELTGPTKTPVKEFEIDWFELSPVSDRVAFRAKDSQGATALFAATLATGSVQQLTAITSSTTHVSPPSFTPDGARIVYRYAGIFIVDQLDLYSVLADGSAAPTLLFASAFGVSVIYDVLDPSGQNVFYRWADVIAKVPVDGSVAGQVLLVTPSNSLKLFVISPDGTQMAVSLEDSGVDRLYIAPAAPLSVALLLSDPLATSDIEQTFEFSNDGSRVLFQVGDEFHTAPADGSQASVQFNTAPVDTVPKRFEFLKTPDGGQVLWVEGDTAQLFIAPVDAGSAPVALSQPYEEILSFERQYALSPDGTRAVFLGDEGNPTPFTNDKATEVFSSSLTGRLDTVLHTPPITPLMPGEVKADFRVSGDGSTVAFIKGDFSTDAVYAAPVDGSTGPDLVSGALALDELDSRELYGLNHSGEHAFHVRRNDTGQEGLFIGPADGSVPPTRVLAGPVATAQLTKDATRVFALVDTDGDNQYEPWVASMDQSAAPYELIGIGNVFISGVVGIDEDQLVAMTNAGDRVVFVATFLADVVLAVAPLDGSAAPLPLTQPLGLPTNGPGAPGRLVVPPGDTHLVYGLRDSGLQGRLYSVPLDGSSAPVQLNGVDEIRWDYLEPTADGQNIVAGLSGSMGIVRIPVDGSSAPVSLITGVFSFQLSEDTQLMGTRDNGNLTIQPVDQSTAPIVVSSVEDFRFGQGACAHRLFYERKDILNVRSLYARPRTGAGAELLIAEDVVPQIFEDPRVSPDGRRLFVNVRRTSPDLGWDLYATPFNEPILDPPVASPRIMNGRIQEYLTTPDGSRLLYRSNSEILQFDELYSVVLGPAVASVTPPALIGTPEEITIVGTGFLPDVTVSFGKLQATDVTYVNSRVLRVVPPIPPRLIGVKDTVFRVVDVTVSDGVVEDTVVKGFIYLIAPELEPPHSTSF